MTQKEFLGKLWVILSKVKDKEGNNAFPCFWSDSPNKGEIQKDKAEKLLELVKLFVEEI
jgi:hypothetical protein